MSSTPLPKRVADLRNRQFDDLTAISIIEISPKQGAIWECLCTCGLTRPVPARNLLSQRATKRVSACTRCVRLRRTERLIAAKKESLLQRGDSRSDYQRNWQRHLGTMSPAQLAVYKDVIERRRRLGIAITPGIRAGAVEVAMTDRSARQSV